MNATEMKILSEQQAEKVLKDLWEKIPPATKKNRKRDNVLERHALFAAVRQSGYGGMQIERATGTNHATIHHAFKNHKLNMLIDEYEEFYHKWRIRLHLIARDTGYTRKKANQIEDHAYSIAKIKRRINELEKEVEQYYDQI